MRPYDAKSTDDVCDGLTRQNKDIGDFWMLTDGYRISLHEQKVGESPSQGIVIPRATFNKFIDWYMREQKAPKERAA